LGVNVNAQCIEDEQEFAVGQLYSAESVHWIEGQKAQNLKIAKVKQLFILFKVATLVTQNAVDISTSFYNIIPIPPCPINWVVGKTFLLLWCTLGIKWVQREISVPLRGNGK